MGIAVKQDDATFRSKELGGKRLADVHEVAAESRVGFQLSFYPTTGMDNRRMVSTAHDAPDGSEGKLYLFTQQEHRNVSCLGRRPVTLLSSQGGLVDGEIPRYGAQDILLRNPPVALFERVLQRLLHQPEVNIRLRVAIQGLMAQPGMCGHDV